jgi:hypothetical protein
MKSWNPFSKVDMEIGSFIKGSVFNKEYRYDDNANEGNNSDDKANENKTYDNKTTGN